MIISGMKKQLKYKNNGRLAVPSLQLRGEICGHGAPIQKKKEKVARKRKKTS